MLCFAQATAAAVLCTAVSSTFLTRTPLWILLLFYELFCVGAAALAFLLSTLFSSATVAAIAAPVLFFAALLPRYA